MVIDYVSFCSTLSCGTLTSLDTEIGWFSQEHHLQMVGFSCLCSFEDGKSLFFFHYTPIICPLVFGYTPIFDW